MTNINKSELKNKTTKNILNEKLDTILQNQKRILQNEKRFLGEELKIIDLENNELRKEDINQKTEESTLSELMRVEKLVKKTGHNSLNKITRRDMMKGFIGAFIGIIGHFAFQEAFHFSHDLTIIRSSMLYLFALFIVIIMLYYTGFKKVKKHLILRFMPIRIIVLYSVSIFAIILVQLVFGNIQFPISFISLYKVVAANMILAVLGATTADLIGGE